MTKSCLKEDQMISRLNDCSKEELTSMRNDDVMIEILIRLPLKSLLKSKCVCKWWRRLISDPIFISNYSRKNPHFRVSGFYLQKLLFLQLYSKLKFITFDGQQDVAPNPSLSFINDERGVFIRHSCNGLLLCSSCRCHEEDRVYYICKPTTKQCLPLPKPECKTVFDINIAFDPKKSPHYRVIWVCGSQILVHHREIIVYYSNTRTWRALGNPFMVFDEILFERGVFWNNGLHWVGKGDLSLRYDIEREVLLTVTMPPIQDGRVERRLGYFGESGDHLYLIEIYGPQTIVFDVMEIERDYSCWFIKYRVDLRAMVVTYPFMVRENVQDIHRYVFSIMHLIHGLHIGGNKHELSLVLHIPGKFVEYDLVNKTFVELRDMSHHLMTSNVGMGLEYSWKEVHPYINTLCYL